MMQTQEVYEFPLSFAQQRLWFLDQLVPGSPFYNVPTAVPIAFPIRVDRLERALNEVVRRHETLRTTFTTRNGEPVQVVAPSLTLELPVVDLRRLPPSERDSEATRLAAEEAQRPFDLATGPLLRTKLLKKGYADWLLLVTMHHIVSDGWSIGVFFSELTTLYSAYVVGRPSPLPELPVQYADFAVWQRQWLQDDVLEEQLSYWRDQLADLPVLQLPTDRPRPAVQSYQGGYETLEVPPSVAMSLRSVAREEEATLFMVLLAGFVALLYRYTGQEDVVVGAPIANRNRTELEGLIGFFVNTQVLRVDCGGAPSFRELLARVKEVALGAYAHQDLPFEMLVEQLQPERDLSRNPLFQVTLQLLNTPGAGETNGRSSIPAPVVTRGTSIFDLALTLFEKGGALSGGIEYSTDLFEAATIRRLIGHYQCLLQAAASTPDAPLWALPMLTDAERDNLLWHWNSTDMPFSRSATLVSLFMEQVERTPEATAVVCGNDHLSYRELNTRANRLAHALRQHGVSTGDIVGLCLERSTAMVVGLLGILKAGAAYLPLDGSYPEERLRFMVEDARVELVLTERGLSPRFEALETDRWSIDAGGGLEDVDGAPPEHDLDAVAGPADLAYVIYTSGSTGRPRGVQISHRAICNHMFWMQQTFPLTDSDVVVQRTPISFDASVWEFYAPLFAGARLVMHPPEPRPDPAALVQTIVRHNVTTLQLVPSLLRLLLEEPGVGGCVSLKRVFCGGEPLTTHLRDRFHGLLDAELCNLYGPTEASIDATYYRCRRDVRESVVPIGRPISNLRAYVVDRHDQPVPIGVPGELLIGGEGLAEGYLNDADATERKFTPDPFRSGARVYRTGDRVRWRADGNLEFLGRMDHQVKLRGYRIEPGEIEATLAGHGAVHEAVVVPHESDAGESRLIAYVVPERDNSLPQEVAGGAYWSEEQVDRWQKVYDEAIYGGLTVDPSLPPATSASTSEFVGWNSSYTGQPIPVEEMRSWVEHTVTRIRELAPRRVLEIGCGTGLLLTRIAPECEYYHGLDFSAVALNHVQRYVDEHGLSQVELSLRKADEISDLKSHAFDVVVLNSVVQYFPSVDYLVRVMQQAVAAAGTGGSVFVGDVRNLALLEDFHASVAFHRAPDALTVDQLRQGIQRRVLEEKELLLDPSFFHALKQHLPAVGRVEIRPKVGSHHNELNRFRYDVVLHLTPDDPRQAVEVQAQNWQKNQMTLSSLRRVLRESEPEALVVTHVPAARLSLERTLRSLLGSPRPPETVGEMRERVAGAASTGVEFDELRALAAEHGYSAHIGFGGRSAADCFKVLLLREGAPLDALSAFHDAPPGRPQPWHAYANNPLQGALADILVPQLRSRLHEHLPDYMMPAAFVLMDGLPRMPNGKVDSRHLPLPDAERPNLETVYVGPRTPTEEAMVNIWAAVLHLETIGIHDDFFADLGGHSLRATQLMSRIRTHFEVEIPLRRLFEAPTVAAISEAVDQARRITADGEDRLPSLEATPTGPADALSEEEVDSMLKRMLEGR